MFCKLQWIVNLYSISERLLWLIVAETVGTTGDTLLGCPQRTLATYLQ